MIVSIDIGSTWTKGAIFELLDGQLVLNARASFPTTIHNLALGFTNVLNKLLPDAERQLACGKARLFYSSSAKGGLAVAALGIVPEITLNTAKMAAASAGAKLTEVFSYRLTRSDIRQLEDSPPDILLFAGGTDGGNTDYVLANAAALAKSGLQCPMIYAGNRCIQDEVVELLSGHDLVCVENLLPTLDAPNPEPTRKAIRSIFLSNIVKGKGLDTIVSQTGIEPLPTPYAVYEFTQKIRKHVTGWDEFVLLDLGGATTDVYSAHKESPATATVIRGIPETECKRTVEGDLGLRVSAQSAVSSTREMITETLEGNEPVLAQLDQFASDLVRQPDFLPRDQIKKSFDSLLAGACISQACQRHAGRMHDVWTSDGMVNVQAGRDLTQVKAVIGTGGYLSRVADFNPEPWIARKLIDAQGKRILLPTQVAYYRDQNYLFPLLANIAQAFPEEAAHAGIDCLTSDAINPANNDKALVA